MSEERSFVVKKTRLTPTGHVRNRLAETFPNPNSDKAHRIMKRAWTKVRNPLQHYNPDGTPSAARLKGAWKP